MADEEGKIKCPKCGQANLPNADFCWECYAPLKTSAPTAPAGGADGAPAASPSPSSSAPTAPMSAPAAPAGRVPAVPGQLPVSDDVPFETSVKRVTVGRVVWVLVGIALIVGSILLAVNVWNASKRKPPSSVAGNGKLANEVSGVVSQGVQAAMNRLGVTDYAVTYYGTSGTPSIAVVSMTPPGVSDPSGSLGLTQVQVTDGTTVHCTPDQAVSPTNSFSACTWEKFSYLWLAVSASGTISALNVARQTIAVSQGILVYFAILALCLAALFGLFLVVHYMRKMFFG